MIRLIMVMIMKNGDSPCNANYMSGDDVVYSYTPASDGTFTMALTALSGTWSGIHVLDGCPEDTPNCVGFEGNSGSADRIFDVSLTGGTTYYIVISTWATPQSVSYTLDINELNCTSATVDSSTVVPDCSNSEFSIEVEVSNAGDATVISDGTNDYAVVAGTVTAGPYATGTVVTLDVVHSDAVCDFSLGDFEYDECPVEVDCSGAPVTNSFCYANNETFTLSYSSSDGSGLAINFTAGTLEDNSFSGGTYDDLIIYDGTDATGTVLYNSDDETGPVDLTGFSVLAASGNLFLAFDSDGSNSCDNGDQTTIEYNVTCASCSSAVVDSSTIVDDCGNSEFSVDVVISDAGDGTFINDGTDTYAVVAGTVTVGPYSEGTSVTLTVEHSDAACDFSLGDFEFFCPPSNVDCANATEIACGETVNANSTGSTGTAEGGDCSLGDNGIWFTFTGTGTDITITSDASFDHEMAISSGACGALVNVGCDDGSVGTETFTFASVLDETYYLYIAHYLAGNTTTGSIDVTLECATCSPVVVDSSTIVETCNPDGTGSFTIDHVVSDAGDGSSVLDDGTNTYAVVAGTVTTGPYNSGDSVTIEVVGLDASCDYTLGTFDFTCPPPAPDNDDVANAIEIPVGDTICETEVQGTNVGATDSGEGDPSCAAFGYNGGDVWFKVVVPATGELTIETSDADTNTIFDTTMEVYSGTSGNLTVLGCDDDDSPNGAFSLVELTGLTPGEVLLIRVWEYNDDVKGNFTICAWSPSTLGVEDNTFNGFTYYPNPVNDILSFESPKTIDNIEVFNMLGQRIIAVDSNNTIQNIDMSNVQSGAYIVKVYIENQSKTIRVIKE